MAVRRLNSKELPRRETSQSFIKKHYDPNSRFSRHFAGSKPCAAGCFSCRKWLPGIADYTTTPTTGPMYCSNSSTHTRGFSHPNQPISTPYRPGALTLHYPFVSSCMSLNRWVAALILLPQSGQVSTTSPCLLVIILLALRA